MKSTYIREHAWLAWLPIPLMATAMGSLWAVDLQVVWPFLPLNWLIHYGPVALGVVFIVIPAAKSFLDTGEPSVLLLGCGVLVIDVGVLAQPTAYARSADAAFAIYNTSALLGALCHFIGVAITPGRKLDLRPSVAWLAGTYASGLVAMGVVLACGFAGWMPDFFVEGHGGTGLRTVVVGAAVILFATTASLLWQSNRHAASPFAFWYSLGLGLLSTGLAGSMAIAVTDSPLQWAARLTQLFGTIYMCVAVFASARRGGREGYPLAAATEVWREGDLLARLRQQTLLGWGLRYSLAVVAVASAFGLRVAATQWVGPGLATYVTFYPAVMAVAGLAGFGPGLLATCLTDAAVAFWVVPPYGQFAVAEPADRLGLVIFTAMGTCMSLAAELYRRSQEKVAAYDREEAVRESRELAEEALRLSEQKFARAFHGNTAAMAISRLRDGLFIDVNERYLEVTRFERAEVVGKSSPQLNIWKHPEDRDRFVHSLRQHGMVQNGEFSFVRKGNEEWTGSISSQVTALGGEEVIISSITDISERKRAETVLQATLQRFYAVLSSMYSGVLLVTDDERVEFANQAFCDLFGVSMAPADLVGLSSGDMLGKIKNAYLHPDEAIARVRGIVDRGLPVKSEEVAMQGGRTCLRDFVPLSVDGKLHGRLWLHTDITERKQAEAAVSHAEAEASRRALELDTVIDSMADGVLVSDEAGHIVRANPALLRVFGVPADWMRRPARERIRGLQMQHDDGRPFELEETPGYRALHGETVRGVSQRAVRADGTWSYVSTSAAPMHSGGAVVGAVVSFADITVRRRAEEALAEEEAKFRAIFENSNDAIVLLDLETGFYVDCNPKMERLSGFTRQQILSRRMGELVPHGRKNDVRVNAAALDKVPTLRGEIEMLTATGGSVPLEYSASVVSLGGRRFLVNVNRDITERRRAEALLHDAHARTTAVLESIADAFYSLDDQWRLVGVNPAAERAPFGRPAGELIGRVIWDVFPNLVGTRIHQHYLDAVEKRSREHYEAQSPLNGRWYEVFMFPRVGGLDVYMRDISDRKQVEQALKAAHDDLDQKVRKRTADLEAANRTLRMLSLCNEALVRARDELEVVTSICRIIHTEGNYRMVWAGYAENDPVKTVTPVAAAGFEEGYLEQAQVSWADTERGQGPTGTCIRTESVRICRDLLTDPTLLPWRAQAVGRGYRSSIALPLRSGGRVFGALTIYAAAPDHFDAGQVGLLTELADDMALGIMALRAQVERDRERQVANQRAVQLRALASELTLAEQRERQRLAQLLHDGLQQLLVGAKFRVGVLERAKDREVREVAAGVADLLSESIDSSRSLTYELSPPILRQGGLVLALEWLVRWMEDKHGLTVNLKAKSDVAPAAEEATVLLFQATRELLFNVVKHSGVKTAQVEVTREATDIRILVADKGRGFDPTQLRSVGGSARGFGLVGLSERLDLLGGRVEIDSAPARGSRFTLVIPSSPLVPGEAPSRASAKAVVSVGVTAPRPPDATTGEAKIRVMLVDDHVVMRQGLAQLLGGEPDLEVVGEASDGESAVELAQELQPAVVLMDINMAGMGGIAATQIIHAKLPEVRIIGLSMFEEEDQAAAMRQAGATTYCAKSAAPASLLATIRACARSGAHAAAGAGATARSRRRRRGAGSRRHPPRQ